MYEAPDHKSPEFLFSNEKFTDLLISLDHYHLVFTVNLSPQGVVWKELNTQVVDHLQSFAIPLKSTPTSIQTNVVRLPDQQEYHIASWQLLKLRTHMRQTARRYEAAARLAVGNFTYINLMKESGHKRIANPRDTNQPLLVLGETTFVICSLVIDSLDDRLRSTSLVQS